MDGLQRVGRSFTFEAMYHLPYFKENDREKVLDFIRQHPFAFLIGCDENNAPVATQVPVFIEEREGQLFLIGHIMRQTDHHKALEKNNAVLCVFSGAHAYVSATWYTNKNQASTWNYASVHVKGTIRFLGEEALKEVLRKTSLHFENNNQASATVFDNLPEDYSQRLMKAIIPFEITVTAIENVFKLSQNRDEKSFENIQTQLSKQGGEAAAVAAAMEQRKQELFSEKKNVIEKED